MVEAARASWSVDPFQLTEKDGYFYGRGVLDMKGEDTALLTALVRLKREGFKPERDIVAFTVSIAISLDAIGLKLARYHRKLRR